VISMSSTEITCSSCNNILDLIKESYSGSTTYKLVDGKYEIHGTPQEALSVICVKCGAKLPQKTLNSLVKLMPKLE